jgi:acetate kinase
MRTIAEFTNTTLIGEFLIVLPVYVSLLLLGKALQGLIAAVKPITAAIPASVEFDEILAILVLAAICFIAGLILCTRAGLRAKNGIDRRVMQRLLGYMLLRGRVMGKADDPAFAPALAEIEEALVPALIVEESENGSFSAEGISGMTTATEPLIGVINAGSSSLKFSFYEGEKRLLTGQVDGIGIRPKANATGADGESIPPPELLGKPATAPSELLPAIVPWAREQLGNRRLAALGHRVVHGGMRYSRPARVTPELLAELERLVPLAPLHEPHNLAPIRMALQLNPDLPQVACFDTAFHRTAPEVEQAFALPHSFYEEGVRRYGFHGLSYEYIASVLPQRAPEIANGRIVVAHLGNGCSACALLAGVSVATTMGFTALDGLPMGTRCGELDAGVVLHLIQQRNLEAEALVDLLYRRSGMLGLSGVSSDFRELLASEEPRARFAVDVFCYRVARHIASLAAALGGLDGVVFTAGVGENAAPVRAAVCRACAWLGLELDEAANHEHRERISTPTSRVAALAIKTDENLMIARHARALAQR